MDPRYERLYDPGKAPVYPLPQRDPMRALADWGAPPEPPIRPYPLDDERAYASPGPPPWATRAERELAVQHGWRPDRRKTPTWALVSVLVGSGLLLAVAAVIVARVSG